MFVQCSIIIPLMDVCISNKCFLLLYVTFLILKLNAMIVTAEFVVEMLFASKNCCDRTDNMSCLSWLSNKSPTGCSNQIYVEFQRKNICETVQMIFSYYLRQSLPPHVDLFHPSCSYFTAHKTAHNVVNKIQQMDKRWIIKRIVHSINIRWWLIAVDRCRLSGDDDQGVNVEI